METGSNDIPPKTFAVVTVVLSAVALAVRLYRIGGLELWTDEALTGHLMHSDAWMHRVHNTPPLYYLLLKGWCGLFGTGEAALRIPSALTGTAFVVLVAYAGRELLGARTGVWAAVFAAVAPIHLYYSQEARAYSLLVAEIAVVYWMLWQTARGAGRGSWALLWVSTAAAVYTHFLAVIPIVLGYVIIAPWRGRSSWRSVAPYAVTLVTVALAFLPWVLWWRSTTEFRSPDFAWTERMWSAMPGWRLIPQSLDVFHLGSEKGLLPLWMKRFSELSFPASLHVVGAIALVAVAVIGLGAAFRGSGRRTVLQLVALTVGPLAALFVASVVVRPVYVVGRYDLIAFPAFVLFVGYALAAATERAYGWLRYVRVTLLAAVLVPMVAKDWIYFEFPERPRMARTAAKLDARVAGGELVVLLGAVAAPALYYLHQSGYDWKDGRCVKGNAGRDFECRMLPLGLETAPASLERYHRAAREGRLAGELDRIVRPDGGPSKVWLVLAYGGRTADGKYQLPLADDRVLQGLIDRGFRILSVDAESNIIELGVGPLDDLRGAL